MKPNGERETGMKAVILSIQPKWCEKIVHRIGTAKDGTPIYEKSVEIRKTRPKIKTPFKCLIYCTLPPKEELFTHGCIREYANELIRLQDGQIVYDYGMRLCCDPEDRPYSQDNFLCKKVIGEFVCDEISRIAKRGIHHNFDYCYLSLNEFGNDDIEIEITNIKESCIPKEELNEYGENAPCLYAWHISDLVIYDKPKELSEFFKACDKPPLTDCSKCIDQRANVCMPLSRPPQSWCYVEVRE